MEMGSIFPTFPSRSRWNAGNPEKGDTTRSKRVNRLDDGHNAQLRSTVLAHGIRVLGWSPYVVTENGSDSRTSKTKDSS